MVRRALYIKHAPQNGIPKLRMKEEKKKIMKLCNKKLKLIDDSESTLFRSVLITNTIRKIKNLQCDTYVQQIDVEEVCGEENRNSSDFYEGQQSEETSLSSTSSDKHDNDNDNDSTNHDDESDLSPMRSD